MSTDRFVLAVGQPRVVGVDADGRRPGDVAHAVELAARAGAAGARLLLLPEHYPGPFTVAESYDAAPQLADAARQHGLAIAWSRMEECADGLWRLVVHVVDRTGDDVTSYARTHPATVPAEQTGGWVVPGEELGEFELDGVRFGIVVCSELWIPETARVLALRGAQVLLSPAGGNFTSLTSNWQAVARVRAIENHCYVAVTNNLYGPEAGAAMVAGPEHVLAAAGHDELLVVGLDLARVRWLRERDDELASVKPFDAIPGLLRARRPELYGELSRPAEGLYDYHAKPADPLVTGAGAGHEGAP